MNRRLGRKCRVALLWLLLLAALPTLAVGQVDDDLDLDDLEETDEDRRVAPVAGGQLDTEPYLNEVQVLGGTLYLGFDLPYDGIVEIKLTDENDRRVFHAHFVKKMGVNQIRLSPRIEIDERRTYNYYFQYKGHVIEGQFRYP